MQYFVAPLALAALAAALPQASTSGECSENYPGTFQIQVVNITNPTKRSAFIEKRQSMALMIQLENGVLTDAQGRIGNIVANDQFQFDPAPGQADAKFTSGFSVCNNGSLAIQGDSTFYQCLSGTFYNLYDEAQAEQCSPVHIQVINGSGGSASQLPDGQVTGSPASEMPDEITGMAVSQIADGRKSPSCGTLRTNTNNHTEIQGPTGAPVQQIGDGQLQATTAAAAPVTQIADGRKCKRPLAAQSSRFLMVRPFSRSLMDAKLQSNGSAPATTSAPAQYTGAANVVKTSVFGLAAGVLALAML
ncbi:covalently-linked cell wall protein [Zymoseptoria brevis]|uniref:Covalently-linked cell wall protein n=1 Tax=Zymoseptoria brevis TaxID=1047168 RepID=A0A0F4GV09_9PEZI|nr:covalently-linked cell wall protein [Zymoseptoria brevis]